MGCLLESKGRDCSATNDPCAGAIRNAASSKAGGQKEFTMTYALADRAQISFMTVKFHLMTEPNKVWARA